MSDLKRLEYHLQDVRLLAEIGSIERYRAVRKSALGACDRLFRNASSDDTRRYIQGIKKEIKEVRYKGHLEEIS